jgi:response regulator RpfG family c-di-GMP phosphodiesterase
MVTEAPAQAPQGRDRVLYVDDDFEGQEAFARVAGAHYEVTVAMDATEALRALQNEGPFAVIVSDLRMPGMDGVALLSHAQASWPTITRVLLTGDGDLESAIAAINSGRIFRFLTKPCGYEAMLQAVKDSVDQYKHVTAERVVLEQTLLGTVKTLTDLLAIASPAAYGRASRVKNNLGEILTYYAKKTKPTLTGGAAYGRAKPGAAAPSQGGGPPLQDRWELEAAALLSQIGSVGLPAATADKLYYGKPMTPQEQLAASRVASVSARLLANIPRLDGIRKILLYQTKQYDGGGLPAGNVAGDQIPWGSRALKIVVDFDVLESQGVDRVKAFETLQKQPNIYDRGLVELFSQALGGTGDVSIQEVGLAGLRPGMVFAEDVIAKNGVLLAARGLEVTPSIMEKVSSTWQQVGLVKPIKVAVKAIRHGTMKG